jgi:hypothetical protein
MQAIQLPFMTLSLVVLFFGGLLIYLFRGRLHESAGRIAVGFSFLATALMVIPFFRVLVDGVAVIEAATWSTVLGEFGLYLDVIAFPIGGIRRRLHRTH